MSKRNLLIALTAASFLMPVILAPVTAQAADDLIKHLINAPNTNNLIVYGPQTNKKIKDASVQGGAAIEVKASGVGESYAAAVQTVIDKPIKAGDDIECDVFLKGQRDDSQPVVLHSRVQINTAPYTNVGSEADFNVTDQWAVYTLKTVADKDYKAGDLVFVVHLNAAKQTVDVGPAFVFDNSRTF